MDLDPDTGLPVIPLLDQDQVDEALDTDGACLHFGALGGEMIVLESPVGMRVPAFQVDVATGRIRGAVSFLNREYLQARWDPWSALAFWLEPSPSLPGQMTPAEAATTGEHTDALYAAARAVRDAWTPTILPYTSLTLDEARAKVAREWLVREDLSGGERELVGIAFGLLTLLDSRARGMAR